jgi:hypothetical protein
VQVSVLRRLRPFRVSFQCLLGCFHPGLGSFDFLQRWHPCLGAPDVSTITLHPHVRQLTAEKRQMEIVSSKYSSRKLPNHQSKPEVNWRHAQAPNHADSAGWYASRRSTRVPLKVVIVIEGGAETRTCDGETIVVNLQGALVATAIELSTGMRISIHVYVTDNRAAARVVYIDPENPLHRGIELDEPRNIWGVPLPPNDWVDKAALEMGRKPTEWVQE